MMNYLLKNSAFYVGTNIVYPPFKNGFYMEEYFLNYAIKNYIFHDKNGRLYIPALWTNFQLESWFGKNRNIMQQVLNEFIHSHPCANGYFTIVQHDDGPFLQLPQNTLIYGACYGHIPLPLIYENRNKSLIELGVKHKKPFSEKNILCSFVGCTTHKVRNKCIDILSNEDGFDISIPEKGWKLNVEKMNQDEFIEKTLNSKFALAPRGYGKSSFRFYEVFQLGCIPVYVWDDDEWLPYKDIIDYSKICISIHENQINELPYILRQIDETKYEAMRTEYIKIQHMFELEFMCKYITSHNLV